MNDKLTILTLEQYLLDELPNHIKEKIEMELLHDAILRSRLENLRQSNIEIRRELHQKYILQDIRIRIKEKEGARQVINSHFRVNKFLKLTYALPLLFGAITIAVKMQLFDDERMDDIQKIESGIRYKGLNPVLHIYKKTKLGAVLVGENARVKQGEVFQLAYIAANAQYGLIFSVDGLNAVTLHYPYEVSMSTALSNDGEVVLNRAYELDGAPKFERFYFISSNTPFSAKAIMRLVEQSAAGGKLVTSDIIAGLPSGLTQISQILLKEDL